MWRSGTRRDCKTNWLWVRSPLEEVKYLLKFLFPFFRSGVEDKHGVEFCSQLAMYPEFGRKWGTECFNIRFPLPTLQCAGYSVKLISKRIVFIVHRTRVSCKVHSAACQLHSYPTLQPMLSRNVVFTYHQSYL